MMRSPGPAFDLRAALSEELRGAIAELDASGGKPKGVHRCRVRLKRARALARVGRACAPGLAAVFNDSARTAMRTLAQARDLAALSEVARAAARKSKKKAAAAFDHVADALEIERQQVAPLDMAHAHAALKDLLALAQVWPEASHRQIKRGAERIAWRARKARQRGHGAEAPARRHEWRKREKDRYYAALLLDSAWPAPRRRKLGENLGEVLGHERDALLLIERVANNPKLAGDAKGAKRALQALSKRRDRYAEKADAIGDNLHAHGA